MLASKDRRKQQRKEKKCGAFCCSCRLSVSSSEDMENSESEKVDLMSRIAHAMVQERLDQLIQGRGRKSRNDQLTRNNNSGILMIAVDKFSYDPREDFKTSMLEMITANQIEQPKELRCLLNCYISMNSEECHRLILEVFHEVCTNLFVSFPRQGGM